jgi:TPR repeat protein
MMKGYVWVLLLAMTSMECVAGFDEGFKAYGAKDYQTALKEFLPLANDGDASAQFALGLMYYNGEGVLQNYSQAVHLYRKAADQGNASAQFI